MLLYTHLRIYLLYHCWGIRRKCVSYYECEIVYGCDM